MSMHWSISLDGIPETWAFQQLCNNRRVSPAYLPPAVGRQHLRALDVLPLQISLLAGLTGRWTDRHRPPASIDPNQQTGLALSKPPGEKPEGSLPAVGPAAPALNSPALPNHSLAERPQAGTSHLWLPSLSPLHTCTRVIHIPKSSCRVPTMQH